jgi:hypothetical protein
MEKTKTQKTQKTLQSVSTQTAKTKREDDQMNAWVESVLNDMDE